MTDIDCKIWGGQAKRSGGNTSSPPPSDDGHNQAAAGSSASKKQVLKKGMFDDKACELCNKKTTDTGYVAGTSIAKLQQQLINMGFLKQEKPDGDFGEKTEQALKDFQTASLKTDRLCKNSTALSKAPSITYTGTSDGICGEHTDDEITLWTNKNWIKPVKSFKKGDSGPELQHFQTTLQDIGVYIDRAVDGWFWNKMQDALNQFQEAAEKGKFLINGVLTDIEKLTGHRKGDLCPKTQDHLKMVKDKGGKVPVAASSGFDIDKAIDYLNKNAVPPYGEGRCATHVRKGILAGGIDITPNPVPAKDYGPYLEKYGFKEISASTYQPAKGDIIVMQSFTGASNPYGHIEMYSGAEWLSDFKQDDLYPGSKYKENNAEYHIYRWDGTQK
jgi:peptidoglycan hydrolase-like protein with peptidoglycan-binding domain